MAEKPCKVTLAAQPLQTHQSCRNLALDLRAGKTGFGRRGLLFGPGRGPERVDRGKKMRRRLDIGTGYCSDRCSINPAQQRKTALAINACNAGHRVDAVAL